MSENNKGKKFEQQIKSSAINQGLFILRLNDTELSFMHNRQARFTPMNPCDFISFYKGYLYMLELKSTEYSSIGIQRTPEEAPKMIKAHQINSLIKYSSYENVNCGFIFNFRDKETVEEETYYLSIENFSKFLYNTDKKSINKLDVIQYDGIKVSQKILRTNYFYDIKNMLIDINKQNIKNMENKGNIENK